MSPPQPTGRTSDRRRCSQCIAALLKRTRPTRRTVAHWSRLTAAWAGHRGVAVQPNLTLIEWVVMAAAIQRHHPFDHVQTGRAWLVADSASEKSRWVGATPVLLDGIQNSAGPPPGRASSDRRQHHSKCHGKTAHRARRSWQSGHSVIGSSGGSRPRTTECRALVRCWAR